MALSPFNYNYPVSNNDSKHTFNFIKPTRTPFDIVKLGDFTFPGISKLDISRSRKAKIQKRKQGVGDEMIDSGLELATVKISTRIFVESDYEEMERILKFFESKVGKGKGSTANSFALNHPDARLRGVFNIFIENIEGPIHNNVNTYTDFTFTCREIVKLKNQTPKRQKEAKQKVIETTTPDNPSVTGNKPSQNKANTQPKRKTPPKT